MKSGPLAVLVLAASLAAPAPDAHAQHAMYFHMGFGRFLEAEKAAEERLKTEEATARILAPLCTIYYKLRRYNKLPDCIARLEQRIARGDATHSDTMMFGTDITPLPAAFKAGMALELGQPARAPSSRRCGAWTTGQRPNSCASSTRAWPAWASAPRCARRSRRRARPSPPPFFWAAFQLVGRPD